MRASRCTSAALHHSALSWRRDGSFSLPQPFYQTESALANRKCVTLLTHSLMLLIGINLAANAIMLCGYKSYTAIAQRDCNYDEEFILVLGFTPYIPVYRTVR